MTIAAHPAADAFPLMDPRRYGELLDDLRANGQRVPIVICDGMILDGRNRFKACNELGIIPKTEDFTGNPWDFVWSLNGIRRDLVLEQRYLIWKHCNEQGAEWLTQKQRIADEANQRRSESQAGIPKNELNERGQTDRARSVDPQRKAKAEASQTNLGAVARGDRLAKDRPDLAAKVRMGEMKPAEAHRQMAKEAVSAKVDPLPSSKFRVIYADPPWNYNDKRSLEGWEGTAAEDHYPSMTISELCALPIADLADTDAVLFMWTTSPLLYECAPVFRSWGFDYKASFVWDKVRHNVGHYNSVRHEFLLVCTKGSCTPDVPKAIDSVQTIERKAKHSQKPEDFRSIIDTLYPKGSRIELFARKAAEGWERWGNQA